MTNHPKSISALNLQQWIISEDEKLVIIDVRENIELEIANFPYTDIQIPMSRASLNYVSSKIANFEDKKIVVLCHKGIRSYNFGIFLLENNFVDKVWNLEEGIDGWSRYIEPSIPRY